MSHLISALTLLAGHQKVPPACKKLSDEVPAGMVVCQGEHDLHIVQLMPLPPHRLLLH